MSAKFRLAADIGGTFTDLVLSGPDGRCATRKVLSTPGRYWQAVVEGGLALLRERSVRPDQVAEICHATTVATNTVLERTGPRTGLITSRGFRDVLELRRMRFPDTYNLSWEKPLPLVERRFRLEVDERIDARGNVLRPLREDDARAVVRHLVETERLESIAVALINSPTNPAHEQTLGRLIGLHYPGIPVSLSSEVLPQLREYERTSTTVLNAYLRPTLSRYLESLVRELRSHGFVAPVYVMHSGGGIMSIDTAIRFPVHVLESGPAAGIVGAAGVADEQAAAVTFDMGGTTAKAALIENGVPFKAQEFEVGAPISVASRVLKGGGYLVRVPAIDVAEVGAGGGSIAALDEGGALSVGPRSAGAMPGPACYRNGGTDPTVTDANFLLGYLAAAGLMGGRMPLDVARAEAVIGQLAASARQPRVAIAHGIRRVAIQAMARAVHSVTTERGRDVRKMTLVAFGGNGPLHAAALAEQLGIERVLVPESAGVFSALGLLQSDNERTFVHPFRADLRTVASDALAQALEAAAAEARAAVSRDRPGHDVALSWFADLRYRGQTFELRIGLGAPGAQSAAQIRTVFEAEYRRTYGHDQPDADVQCVNAGCVARTVVDRQPLTAGGAGDTSGRAGAPADADDGGIGRDVFFSTRTGFLRTAVIGSRRALGEQRRQGPLLIDEYDSTTVVPPGWQARLAPSSMSGPSILLERAGR
ncbi:MAG: hydantoinase/oxoprolinase family protein [Lautropia sp.]